MFVATVRDSHIDLGTDYNRARVKEWCRHNEGARIEIKPILPESRKMRGFLEGGVLALITFYQVGMDHRNHADIAIVREWMKIEHNGDMVNIGGKIHRIAKSTKGRENLKAFTERVIDWLTDNYNPPKDALDPEKFKHWRDTIFPFGGPDNYIDYLVEIGILKNI